MQFWRIEQLLMVIQTKGQQANKLVAFAMLTFWVSMETFAYVGLKCVAALFCGKWLLNVK